MLLEAVASRRRRTGRLSRRRLLDRRSEAVNEDDAVLADVN
jgi:hypothetical protein